MASKVILIYKTTIQQLACCKLSSSVAIWFLLQCLVILEIVTGGSILWQLEYLFGLGLFLPALC